MCGHVVRGLVVALDQQPQQAVQVQVLEHLSVSIAHEVVSVFDVALAWLPAKAGPGPELPLVHPLPLLVHDQLQLCRPQPPPPLAPVCGLDAVPAQQVHGSG